MAHLWVRDAERVWAVVSLAEDMYTLTPDMPYVARRPPHTGEAALARPLPKRGLGEVDAHWVLLLSETTVVRVNGSLVVGGIKALADRDEIRGPGLGRCYFSTEQLAVVSPYRERDGQESACPRCKLLLAPDTPAVRCPVCGVWHHQDEIRSCWSYADVCAVCGHDTSLDQGFLWSPAEL